MPPEIVASKAEEDAAGGPFAAAIAFAFPNLAEHAFEPEYFAGVAVLASLNSVVDEVNNAVLDAFPGNAIMAVSSDVYVRQDTDAFDVPLDYIHTISTPQLPPHKLLFKIGCVLMLLRNLSPAQGQCNGTKLKLDGVLPSGTPRILECTIISGPKAGNRILIPRIQMVPSEGNFPFSFKRRQFPVRLAFATTINKSQGQTLRRVAILLEQPVFTHGQLYVALSRSGAEKRARVFGTGGSGRTRNVVYKEVLQRPQL